MAKKRPHEPITVPHLFAKDGRYHFRFEYPAKLRSYFGKGSRFGTLQARPPHLDAAIRELRPIEAAHRIQVAKARALPAETLLRERIPDATHDQTVAMLSDLSPDLSPDVLRLMTSLGGPEGLLSAFYDLSILRHAATLRPPAPDLDALPVTEAFNAFMRVRKEDAVDKRAEALGAAITPALQAIGLEEPPDTLSLIAEKWLTGGKRPRQPNTLRRLKGTIRRLVEVIGDVPVASINPRQLQGFLEMVASLPAAKGEPGKSGLPPEMRSATVPQLVAWANAHPRHPKVEATTRNVYAASVKALFGWAKRRGIITSDPSEDIERNDDIRAPSEKRRRFKPAELSAIEVAAKAHWGTTTERYLVLMVATYTGMRLTEPCGLRRADLRQDPDCPGSWFFDLKNNTHRRLKTPESERLVPVHPDLEAALVAHAESVPAEDLLFPSMGPGDVRRRADRLSAQFTDLIRAHAGIVKGERVTWHSLRHSWEAHAVAVEMPERVRLDLIGEKPKGRQGLYNSAPALAQKVKWMARMDPFGLRAAM